PRDHRRAAGGRGVEHQPGDGRPADRRVQPRLPVHRRAAACLPDRDLRRHGANHRAGGRLRPSARPETAGAPPVGGALMSFFSWAWDWISQSANWQGAGSIPRQILAHLGYSGLPLLFATLIGIPAGVAIGHTRRGAVLAVNLANSWRAIPTLGLLIL